MNSSAYPDLWVLLPVKRFAMAKSRLGRAMDSSVRSAFAQAMYLDVLKTLGRCVFLAGVVVVTADQCAASLALEFNAKVLHDDLETGTNAAVQAGLHYLAELGAGAVLVIPSDIPLVETDEVLQASLALLNSEIVIAPDERRAGTNLLGIRLPNSFQTHFGPNSFQLHLQEARRLGLSAAELHLPGLSLDVDAPGDLQRAAVVVAADSHTANFLNRYHCIKEAKYDESDRWNPAAGSSAGDWAAGQCTT